MNKEQLLSSLEKIELLFDPERLYIFTFKKDEWTTEDAFTFSREINRLYPEIKKMFMHNEIGSFDITALNKSEKIELIKNLIDSL